MQCPRCQNVVLDELDRDGITVDRCSRCRGIWLDRGELEKLIAREAAETSAAPPPAAAYPPAAPPGAYPPPQAAYPPGRAPYGYDDREPPSSSRRGHYRHKRHRSFWLDLFD